MIDAERRAMLTAKFKLDADPEPDNAIVEAICTGERLHSKMFNWRPGITLAPLWDPMQCPEMYQISDAAMVDLRKAMARGEIEYGGGVEYERDSGPVHDPDQIEDDVMLVNIVGHKSVQVVRGWPFELDQFAALFQTMWPLTRANAMFCRVKIAPRCDGFIQLTPLLRGQFLLLFPICYDCFGYAINIAGDGQKLAVIDAHERLAAELAQAAEASQPADINKWRAWWFRLTEWLWEVFYPPSSLP